MTSLIILCFAYFSCFNVFFHCLQLTKEPSLFTWAKRNVSTAVVTLNITDQSTNDQLLDNNTVSVGIHTDLTEDNDTAPGVDPITQFTYSSFYFEPGNTVLLELKPSDLIG